MSCEESHHPPPKAVMNINTAGHPTGVEMLAGALLVIVGFFVFITWVATFDSIYAVGIVPLLCGYILLFHSEPLLETLKQWKATGAESRAKAP